MPEDKKFYNISDYGDDLRPGQEICINHRVYVEGHSAPIEPLISQSVEDLKVLREVSVTFEQNIFEKLLDVVKEWDAQAAQTALLNRAIDYVQMPVAEHTENQWKASEHDWYEISNTVYRMSYHVYEDVKYNRDAKEHEVVAWRLSWSVGTNPPSNSNYRYNGSKIAGQDRKRFTDKAAMEKYLDGRIKAYSHLFTEVSPPIPQRLANDFKVYGQLLPGYTIEGQEHQHCKGHTAPEAEGGSSIPNGKPSVLKQLADIRPEGRKVDAPDKLEKPRGPEL